MITKEKLHFGSLNRLQDVLKKQSGCSHESNQAPDKAFRPRPRQVPAMPTAILRIATKQEISMGRLIAFLYGLASYVVFFASFLYAIGFVEGLVVPKTIDSGTATRLAEALIVNLLLMSLFAIQHSVMARPQFKQWWTRLVPKSVERSTYVLFSSLALLLLFWQWRPMPAVVWQIGNPQIAMAVVGCRLSAG